MVTPLKIKYGVVKIQLKIVLKNIYCVHWTTFDQVEKCLIMMKNHNRFQVYQMLLTVDYIAEYVH